MPNGQGVQEIELTESLKVPGPQETQFTPLKDLPAGQSIQVIDPVSSVYIPIGHVLQFTCAFVFDIVFFGHKLQVVAPSIC
jgi:hypothetical protein